MPILPQASSAAGRVDAVFFFILVLCVAFLALITTALIYFVIRYNRKRHPKAEDIEGNLWLETTWTVVPLLLFLAMFVYGWTNFSYMRQAPRDAMVIEATGRQWAWSFRYPNGRQSSELILALDRPVKLELRSQDVLHGFFIPAFRIKEDVVPGKDNYTWFSPTQLGSFDIECTVICGVSHANMLAKAVVVPVSEFEGWYFGDDSAPPPWRKEIASSEKTAADHPALAIMDRRFCLACHSIDGKAMVGPSFKGAYGLSRVVLDADGAEKVAPVDDAYLLRAIQDPGAETVKGYPPAMPKAPLPASELHQVVEYIKMLR